MRFEGCLLCLVCLLPAGPATGGQMEGLELSKPRSDLLAGRLTVRLPVGARIEPRQKSIMAAAEAASDETRVVLDTGKARFVMMVYEMYALVSDGDLKKQAAGLFGGIEGSLEPMELSAAKVKAVAFAPEQPQKQGKAMLVLGVVLASPDKTLQYLAFYVNPEGARDWTGARELARRIVATVSIGSAKLPLGGGKKTLKGLEPGTDLLVEMPAGFVVSHQRGPDFLVHHIRKLVPLGDPVANLGVYLGGHPSYQYRQSGLDEKQVTRSSGTLLGKEAEWVQWTAPKKKDFVTVEAITPVPSASRLYLHVFCQTGNARHLDELKKTAESIRTTR